MSDVAVFIWILFIAHIIIAILYCFSGYRNFRVLTSVYVFLLVFPLVLVGLQNSTSLSESVTVLIAVGVAALATALTWAIYKVAIFICGGLLGAGIAIMIFQSGLSTIACLILGVALFVLFGIITLKFRKILIILSSSIIGGFSLFVYGYYIIFKFGAVSTLDFTNAAKLPFTFSEIIGTNYLVYLIPIAISIIGIIVQATAGNKRKKKSDNKHHYDDEPRKHREYN